MLDGVPAHVAFRNRAAVGQGTRTAIVAFGGFCLGYWGLHRLQIAVFATFGGLALTGIANFGGTLRGRAGANAVSGVAGVALASAGTWASHRSLGVACAVTFGIGALMVLTGLFGGYFAVASTAVTLYYLVAIGSPAPTTVLPDRVDGVLIGAALAVVGAVVLWPGAVDTPVLPLLAAEMEGIARALRTQECRRSDDRPGDDLRTAVEAGGYRPAGPTAHERAALSLLNDLERLDRLQRQLAIGNLTPDELVVVDAAGQRLSQAAAILAGEPPPAPPVTGAGIVPGDPARVRPFGLAYRVRVVVDAAVAHAATAGRHRPVGGTPATGERLADAVLHAGRRLGANLSLRSVHLQDALRTGLALAVAYFVAREFALEHGFWVELATLTVVRSGAAATSRFVGQAVAGTAVGAVIAFAFIEVTGASVAAYAVVTPLAIAVAIYLRAAINFAAGQAGFTVSVLLLFSLLKPSGWHIGIVRLEDVVVGVLAGLAASVLAWPRGAAAAIGPALADLIDTASAYLVLVALRAASGAPDPGADRTATARQVTMAAMLRAESAYSQVIAERADQTAAVAWSPTVAAANRLWYAADIIATAGPVAPDGTSVGHSAERLRMAARRTGEILRRPDPRPPHTTRPESGPSSADDPLAAWIDDLAAQFQAASPNRVAEEDQR